MITGSTSMTWEEATKGFFRHIKAVRAAKTLRFYEVQLTGVVRWANREGIRLAAFRKMHLDDYLAERVDHKISQTTLHHDALATKVFFKWCVRNDVLDRNPLADYQVRDAPKTEKYMPTPEDMGKLIEGLNDFWNVEKNPTIREVGAAKRSFHRDRNYAIVLTLLDSAARIGEVLSFQVDDYREGQLTIRESKGRESRTIPVSKEGAEALQQWLVVRRRIMKEVPKSEDEGWLFISETGTRIDEKVFLRSLKRIVSYCGANERITLHSLRRYSLNRLAKHNLLAAQAIAGHKDTKTTLIYTRIDPDFIREQHELVGVVRGIVNSKRPGKKKRLVY